MDSSFPPKKSATPDGSSGRTNDGRTISTGLPVNPSVRWFPVSKTPLPVTDKLPTRIVTEPRCVRDGLAQKRRAASRMHR